VLYENGKPSSSHNRLGITGQKKGPLRFTKMESPAAAIIGWVSQDKKNGLWALPKSKAQQRPYRLGITGPKKKASRLSESGKPSSSHNRLGITGQKKWPLGFSKLESPAAIILSVRVSPNTLRKSGWVFTNVGSLISPA